MTRPDPTKTADPMTHNLETQLHLCLGLTRLHISIGSAIVAQLTAESRYTLQRAASFPLKIAPSQWAIWTPI